MFSAQNSQVSSAANYIEDVFSTWLYNGTATGVTNTITNNINLSGKGGLVWLKIRNTALNNILFDTARGDFEISSNTTAAQANNSRDFVPLSTGFSLKGGENVTNNTGNNYVSWTFREQPKFFDIVTYTGTGSNTTIPHNLGSVPGCIIIKRTDAIEDWNVYHRSLANTQYMILSGTAAALTGTTRWNSTTPTSTVFSLGTSTIVNASGGSYVAYVFAHDAGGFGLTGTDNAISCGTFTGPNQTVTLGYEPQWILYKDTATAGTSWQIIDNIRGMSLTDSARLFPNSSGAELTGSQWITPTATGFITGASFAAATFIYIAIRRGPMKVPTLGTSVFGISARTGTGANVTVTGGSGVDDAVLVKNRGAAVGDLFASRLTGTGYLETSATTAEVAAGVTILQANPWDVMDGVKVGTTSTITNASANTFVNYLFSRAPGFFDVVCYTGTGVARTVAHNLTVVPELMIIKLRSAAGGSWPVYHVSLGPSSGPSLTYANAAYWGGSSNLNSTTPTNSVFTVGTDTETNDSGKTYISYLFATCPGVSKVGSYTGNGTTQTIDCGLTSGARFVLIKRTDATGDWYVYDTARGMTVLTNPYLRLNSIAIETATLGSVTTVSTGFALNSTILAAINVNAGTYIFLAIA
jgi:hypothetical protein